MQLKYTLNINSEEISFGIADSKSEMSDVFKQRCRVYSKYGYIDSADCVDGLDSDEFDEHSVHIVAYNKDKRLLGSVRMINSTKLPIQTFFDFGVNSNFPEIPRGKLVELSRIVVCRRDSDSYIPRNILIVFMSKILVDVAIKNDFRIGLAYLKESLLKKILMLKMPVTVITDYKCIYPEGGFMSKYFYKDRDSVTPAFFILGDFLRYLDDILVNKNLFECVDNTYTLHNTMYTRFLKSLRIL